MARATLITGGSRGIGYALAEALLRNGDQVAITGTSTDGVMRAEHALAAEQGSRAGSRRAALSGSCHRPTWRRRSSM